MQTTHLPHIGDCIETPRFLKVRIDAVFTDFHEAQYCGYTEPTHFQGDYLIMGKSYKTNHMRFAAVCKQNGESIMFEFYADPQKFAQAMKAIMVKVHTSKPSPMQIDSPLPLKGEREQHVISAAPHEPKSKKRATFAEQSPHTLLEKDTLTPKEQKQLLSEYMTRGRALKLENDRGIIDSHIRRENNLGQFFTPSAVVKVMTQALGLAHHSSWGNSWTEPVPCSAIDFSGCGNGRLFEHLPKDWHLSGADIDPLAVRAAKLIYPNAEIIESDFLDFRFTKERYQTKPFDLALINPPFSIRLNSQTPTDLICAEWGIWGRNTSHSSHWAALEMALRCADVVAAILPTTALEGDNATIFNKIKSGHSLTFRLDLPPSAFSSEGTEWPCSILIFSNTHQAREHYTCATWDEVEKSLTSWVKGISHACDTWKHHNYRGYSLPKVFRHTNEARTTRPTLASFNTRKQSATIKAGTNKDLKGNGINEVRLCLAGRAHKIILKPSSQIARLAIEEAKLWTGWITSEGFKAQSRLEWNCDLVRYAGNTTQKINEIKEAIEAVQGITVSVDKQLLNHAEKADRRALIEMNRHSQWIKKGDTWDKQGKDDIDCTDHPAYKQIESRYNQYNKTAKAIPTGLTINKFDRTTAKHIPVQYPPVPVFDFSIKDIVRSLGRRAVIYSAKQGLAKSRYSIGAVLASGVSKALWVLESRLVNEFRRELSKIGMLEHFHFINTAKDLKNLKLFNVITYSRLWKPVSGHEAVRESWGPGKSFAAALAKRRMMVILDEAHKIKSATSKQGIAARHLCNRAKRVILMTGTAIQSYPRNILGLVNAGWGDGSSMNPYGYRRPMEGGYDIPGNSWKQRNALMKGVQIFVDEFVDTIWYTAQFAQTASTGMKSREIPKIKNPTLWKSFVAPKLIRRVPNEPEVRASGVTTPEAKPRFECVEPDKAHFGYYKIVLDQFANIWKERLKKEKEGARVENNVACILPELDALRFASTAPLVEHRWAEDNALLKNGHKEPTAVMLKALEKISDWVSGGDRVIIGAEKPAALHWLADLLADLPSYVTDSEPIEAVLALDSDINKRNAAIDKARDDSNCPVLLISIGMGKEGLNLPEFSKLLTLDFGWVPGDLDQYRHRILRPGQTGDVEIVHLYHKGMIDSYMKQLCDAKSDAIAEVIDGQESTFNYENWRDYRGFVLDMLSKEGYEFAAQALREGQTYLAKAA